VIWLSVCLFCASVVLCVGNSLTTGLSPVQGVLSTVYMIKNLEKQSMPNNELSSNNNNNNNNNIY
jgi:hypothetical protein